MKLSIVTTLYCSAPYVEEFHRRASAAARQLVGEDYEIVMVNDGSPDNAADLAIALTKSDPHLVVVDLSRNFGHHRAMMAGLEQVRGETVFLIDVDLEEEPEWLLSFAAEMEIKNCDVVYGVQQKRKGGWFERWSGAAYYYLLNWLTGVNYPQNIVTARVMTRRYVDALLLHTEREVVFSCLCYITGFTQVPYAVLKHSSSPTTYTLAKKLALVARAVTSFSDKPLKLFFNVGLLITFLAVIYAAWLILRKLAWGISADGWTSVMVSIWGLGGLIILQLGLIGIYLSNIFIETKKRPLVIIRAVHNGSIVKE